LGEIKADLPVIDFDVLGGVRVDIVVIVFRLRDTEEGVSVTRRVDT